MLIQLLILCSLTFLLVSGGQVYSHDIRVSPNNRGTPSEFTFIFSLETSISSSDYLRIIFPFTINALDTDGVYDVYEDCSVADPTRHADVQVSVAPGDTDTFFVQFYDDSVATNLVGLDAGVTYYLKFTGTPDAGTTLGTQLPIQVFTVSNNAADWIYYDSNPTFGFVSINDAYPTSMAVSFQSLESDKDNVGASYDITIDITPTVTILNRARIQILLTDDNFELLSCVNEASSTDGISALDATFQTDSETQITAIISETLTAENGAKYRFSCTVLNPFTAATGGVTVNILYGYADTITESGTQATGLQASNAASSTTTWEETSHKILLGWGYLASDPSAIDVFGVYKDASATEKWYQAAKIIFKPATDLTVTTKLRVTINTIDDDFFTLLATSVFHNLPDFSDEETVTCSSVRPSIVCENVGQLQNLEYFISFKFNLASSTTQTSAANFGRVEVETQSDSSVLIALSSTALTNQAILDNVALFTGGGTEGRVVYSETGSGDEDYVTNGEDITLKFRFMYFDENIIPLQLAGAGDINRGIEFYTSYALEPPVLAVTCAIDTIVDTVDAVYSDCTVEKTADSHTRLRFRLANFQNVGSPSSDVFATGPNDGTITFDPIQFSSDQFSSLNLVNENVFDYYVRWVEGFTDTSPTVSVATNSVPFFFNSLVYTKSSLGSVDVGTVFLFAGDSGADDANDGSYFPTLIRVTGELIPAEQASDQKLLIFFNDMTPLDEDNPCFGPVGVSCTYTDGGSANTDTDMLTDYSGSKRIIIDTDLTEAFNIYIPVSTTAGQHDYGFFVATATEINSTTSSLNLYETGFTKRVAVRTTAQLVVGNDVPTALSFTAAGGGGALLDIPASTKAGDLVASTTISGIAGAWEATPNAAGKIGSHYGYCANFDFAEDSGFAMEPYYTGGAVDDELCVTVRYTVSDVDKTCHVCPVYSAMAATPAVDNFRMPSEAGRDYYDAIIVFGDEDGDYSQAAFDVEEDALDPFVFDEYTIKFAPGEFRQGAKNIKIEITFTPESTIPATFDAVLEVSAPSTSLFFTAITTIDCESDTFSINTCTVEGTSDDTIITLHVAANEDLENIEHTIVFMADSTDPGLGADEDVDYTFKIQVDGVNALDPVHHDAAAAETFTVLQDANEDFVLSNMGYLFGNEDARTIVTFAFTIPSDMIVYNTQTIQFDIGGLENANSGEEPTCYVKESDNSTISTDFLDCDISDLTAITLVPKTEATGQYVVVLEFLKVHSANTDDIVGKIIAVDDATDIVVSAGLELIEPADAEEFSDDDIEFVRDFSDPGNVGSYQFTITTTEADIRQDSFFYFYFPSYYAANLGYRNLYCTADNEPISCFIYGQRILQVTAFPERVSRGTPIDIEIYGIITPAVPAPVGKIFIGFDTDDDPFELVQHIEIDDLESDASLPEAFRINTLSHSSNTIRNTNDYSFTLQTNITGVSAGTVISVDFPDMYGPVLRVVSAPLVTVKKESSSVTTTIQSTTFGSRIKIPLTIELEALVKYQITIKELRNPESAMCDMDRPTITMTGPDEASAFSRSAPNLFNALRTDYIVDSELTNLRFTDEDGDEITALTIPIGIQSPVLRIAPPEDEEFSNDIIFQIAGAEIDLLPTLLQAESGAQNTEFRIGASSNNYPSLLLIDFTKTESLSEPDYAELPLLQLTITNDPITIPTPEIRIMQGGTSLPYYFDLDELNAIPYTEVIFTATIDDPETSTLTVSGTSSLVFSRTETGLGFVFLLDETADSSDPPTFQLSISGENAANYEFEETEIEVEVLDAESGVADISELTVESEYAPTSQLFSIELTQMATVYWHVAYEGKLSTEDCNRVRSEALEKEAFDPFSYNQEQFGIAYVYREDDETDFIVKNLLSGTTYSYIVCPYNQLERATDGEIGTFTTASNGFSTVAVNIEFEIPINRAKLAALVCVFTIHLQLPDRNVIAMDGTTCSRATVLDDLSSFDYSDITIYVNANKRSTETQTIQTQLNDLYNAIAGETPSAFKDRFYTTLETISEGSNFVELTVEAGPTYSDVTISGEPTVTKNDTVATITGISLSGSGYFFAIADDSGGVNVPTVQQIKEKKNALGATVKGANSEASGSIELNVTTLLPSTTYQVYYVGTNQDLSQYTLATVVGTTSFTTDERIVDSGAIQSASFVSIVIVLITCIFGL